MGCRCTERAQALKAARRAIGAGQVAAAASQIGYVTRTLVEDTRSGALRQAALRRVAQLRKGAR